MSRQTKILLVLVLCMYGFTNIATAREKAERIITKSFDASSGYTLAIESKYGNINVQTWNKNEIHFEIKISGEARTKKEAEDIINSIDVQFSQTGKTISAKTIFPKTSCNYCSRDINYQVMVPKGINYSITNMYGNVNIPDATGDTDFIIKYGNLTTGNLEGSKNKFDVKYGHLQTGNITKGSNYIDVKYGDIKIPKLTGSVNEIITSYGGKVSIDETNKMKIDIKYSNLKIGSGDELDIESGYTNTSIDRVKKLKVTSKYEKYDIGEVDELTGEFGYTNVSIDKLGKFLKISEIKYGKLDIDYVSSKFDNIDVYARYTHVTAKFDPKAVYNVDLFTKYGNIDFSNVAGKMTYSEPSRNSKEASGVVGGMSAKSNVKIECSYADIKLR